MRLNIFLAGLVYCLTMNVTVAPPPPPTDCKFVLKGDGMGYPIDLINRCNEERRSGVRSERNKMCPYRFCLNHCPFGYKPSPTTRCPTCQCEEEGKERPYQGDIILAGNARKYFQERIEGTDRAAPTTLPLWKMYRAGKNYYVPYVVSSSIGKKGQEAIDAAISDFHLNSCIRFAPRKAHHDKYLDFYKGAGCSSPIGQQQNRQRISLAQGCWSKGTVIHEILHSLGVAHEQSRQDRDYNVQILTPNIINGFAYNFEKQNYVNSRTRYDVRSIMHYSSYAFSRNGQPTIVARNGNVLNTQRDGFSDLDIDALKELYCNNYKPHPSCYDVKPSCSDWFVRNFCSATDYPLYVNYMRDNCKQTCNYC